MRQATGGPTMSNRWTGVNEVQACSSAGGALAYRCKSVRIGRRQIISFHVPGDMLDLQTIRYRAADHTIETSRNATVLLIPHDALLKVAADYPALRRR